MSQYFSFPCRFGSLTKIEKMSSSSSSWSLATIRVRERERDNQIDKNDAKRGRHHHPANPGSSLSCESHHCLSSHHHDEG